MYVHVILMQTSPAFIGYMNAYTTEFKAREHTYMYMYVCIICSPHRSQTNFSVADHFFPPTNFSGNSGLRTRIFDGPYIIS